MSDLNVNASADTNSAGKPRKTEVVMYVRNEYGIRKGNRRLATPDEAKVIESVIRAGKRAMGFYLYGVSQHKQVEEILKGKIETAVMTCKMTVEEQIPGCDGEETVFWPLMKILAENRKRLRLEARSGADKAALLDMEFSSDGEIFEFDDDAMDLLAGRVSTYVSFALQRTEKNDPADESGENLRDKTIACAKEAMSKILDSEFDSLGYNRNDSMFVYWISRNDFLEKRFLDKVVEFTKEIAKSWTKAEGIPQKASLHGKLDEKKNICSGAKADSRNNLARKQEVLSL